VSNPFDFDAAAPSDVPQAVSRPGSRRPVLGPASLSVGGFVMLFGGLVAVLAAFMPGYFPRRDTVWAVLLGVGNPWRVLFTGLVALAVGGAFLRVRVVHPPLVGDYAWTAMGLGGGLLVALQLLLSGVLNSDGVAAFVVMLASIAVAIGAAVRAYEQVTRWRKPKDYDRPADDPPWLRETDPPPKTKPRPRPDSRRDPKR
jgi:hypothetical protein